MARSRGPRPSGRSVATAAAWAAPSIPTASPDTTTAPTDASASAIRAAIRPAGLGRPARPDDGDRVRPRRARRRQPRTNRTGGGSSIRRSRAGYPASWTVTDVDVRGGQPVEDRLGFAGGLPDRVHHRLRQPDAVPSRPVADPAPPAGGPSPDRGRPPRAAVLAAGAARTSSGRGRGRAARIAQASRSVGTASARQLAGVRAARHPEAGRLLEVVVSDAGRSLEVGDRPGDPLEPADAPGRQPGGRGDRADEGLVGRRESARRPEPRPVEPGVGDALAGQRDPPSGGDPRRDARRSARPGSPRRARPGAPAASRPTGRSGRGAARTPGPRSAPGRPARSDRPGRSRPPPHGHGFIAATSWKRAGRVSEPPTRTIETRPSSSGWRSASRTSRPNSGSSSRNSTPSSARVTSPGDRRGPPPSIPA